jgi:hypothetical protein
MAEVATAISNFFSDFYTYFVSILPSWAQNFLGIFLLVLVLVVYSIFIWKFYRFISKKNIIELNLKQYNRSEHPFFSKISAFGLYVIEYILFVPAVIFFSFVIFTIFLILLTDEIPLQTLLILSATIIGAIRMTAYYKEDVSKEIAKLIPFTLLAVSMTKSGFFNFERIISNITQLPQFFNHIVSYLIFIVIIEIVLRFFEFIFGLFGLTDMEESSEEE